MTEATFVFASASDRVLEVVSLLDALPRLGRGALEHFRLGWSTAAGHCVCVAHFPSRVPEATRARLEFWAWRVGGSVRFDGGGTATAPRPRAAQAALRSCDVVADEIAPGMMFGAVRRVLGRLLGPNPDLVRGRLVMKIPLGTPAAAGVEFHAKALRVFIPTPKAPPVGETINVEFTSREGESLAAEGVVTGLREAGEEGPGTPAGFLLGLISADERLEAVLQREALQWPEPRRAPRYPTLARVALRPEPPARDGAEQVVPLPPGPRTPSAVDYVENLSQAGAFVRTDAPVAPGTRVVLDLELPGGVQRIPGTVVRATGSGVGVRFEPEAGGDAAIGAALEVVAVQRRRALVVDDDGLARRMMGDALGERGFDVFTAADGQEGLRALIDLLLHLDVFIIDLHMPGLNGEGLIKVVREAGGERDLAILVMSGSVDDAVERRLRGAGADAVLPKSLGMAAIADAAVKIMLSRGPAEPADLRWTSAS